MNKKNYSRFMMCLKVQQFKTTYRGVVSVLPEFAQIEATVDEGIVEIQSLEVELSRSKAGIVMEKSRLKEQLAQYTSELAGKIYAFALITNDTKLQNEVRLTDSQLYYASDLNLLTRAKSTYDFSCTHLDNLADYEVTQTLVEQHKSAIDLFEASFMNPQNSVVNIRKVIGQLNEKIATVENALSRMDAVLEIIRYSNPTVYQAYKSARKVVMTIRSLALKGRVLETNGIDSIKGATLSFVAVDENATNTESVLVKVSAEKGGFQVKSIAEGDYVVSITKKGYKDVTVNLSISGGEPADLVVKLEKA